MRPMLILATLIAALTATADGQVKIYKLEAGHYMVQGDGIVTCQIVAPDVPTPPNPPVPSDLAKAIVAAVNAIPVNDARHTAALKLAAVCQVIGGQVADGKIHPTDAAQALSLVAKAALAKDATAWSGVLTVIESALTKATTADASAKVFSAAGAAVLSTVPNSADAVATLQSGPLKDNAAFKSLAQKYGFDWDTFLAFLIQLLTLLLPLITWLPKIVAVALLA